MAVEVTEIYAAQNGDWVPVSFGPVEEWGDTEPVGEVDKRWMKPGSPLLDAIWRVDAANLNTAKNGLVDLTSNGRDAIFGAGAAAPTVLPWSGKDYIHCPAGSWIDLANVSGPITGNSGSIIFDMPETLAGVASGLVVSDGSLAAGIICIWSDVNGCVNTHVHEDAVSGVITATATPVPVGAKVEIQFVNSTLSIYVNDILSAAGTAGNQAQITLNNVRIGSNLNHWVDASTNKWLSCTCVVDGVTVAEMLPANHNTDYTAITNTGTIGDDWTIVRAAAGAKLVVVDRPLLLFSDTQSMETSPWTADGPLETTILIAARLFGTIPATPTDYYYLIDTGPTVFEGKIQLRFTSPNRSSAVVYGTGGSNDYVNIDTIIPGQHVYGASVTSTIINCWPVGVDTTPNRVIAPLLLTGNPIACGGMMEFLAAAVWDRALTNAEMSRASVELAAAWITPPDSIALDHSWDPVKAEYVPLRGSTLRELTDVNIAAPPPAIDKQSVVWNTLTTKWEPGTGVIVSDVAPPLGPGNAPPVDGLIWIMLDDMPPSPPITPSGVSTSATVNTLSWTEP
jgi:hypothetical protein